MTARYIVGDVFDVLATLEPGSVDLVMSSPPFLALRSYLPADHPDKAKEIGSEPTPAAFIDTLLDATEACARVLAPHGSLVFELGDTYSGSGGAGGDYNAEGLRDGQQRFDGSASRAYGTGAAPRPPRVNRGGMGGRASMVDKATGGHHMGGNGWPLAKSLCLIPESYRWALVYGRNPHNGRETPPWRARNVVRWVRPNPPVGCVDDQTEALTLDGWRPHDELRDGDLIAAYDPKTDSCRFLPASFVRWHREGESMVAIDKRVATSQRLTEDHRAWTRTRKAAPHVRLARDLTNDCETLLCASFDDVAGPSPVTVERAALLGWYIAEGSPSGHQARIVQSETANPHKVERIRSLLEADGADFAESPYVARYNDSTIITFRVKGELAEWLNLHHKRLPMQYATTWPEAQAQALFDALIDGDGHRRKNAEGVLFHQQDERVIDAVQVLALRLGYRAIKSWQRAMNIWQLTLSKDTARRSVRWTKVRTWEGEGIRRETYTGVVWCPQIETTFWLARRNGRTFVTGNSLGDKFRPATSDLVVACKARDRWFDLDAVRTQAIDQRVRQTNGSKMMAGDSAEVMTANYHQRVPSNPAGAPPLDWWSIPPTGYSGSHYAVYPPELCRIPIEAMCPRRVCRTCNQPSRRETTAQQFAERPDGTLGPKEWHAPSPESQRNSGHDQGYVRVATTTGWSSCGCPNTDGIRLDGYHTGTGWRPGVVLDPFAGSGTTLLVATGHGRDAIGIDLDSRNADLARERVGMWLEVEHPERVA